MTQVPLPGEQSALRGYRWQYDHVARLVYDAIIDGEFDRLTLASTGSGQLDDLLLFLRGRREAYQFKGGVSRATITFKELLRPGKTPAKQPVDSLWRALARGWQRLEAEDERPLTVHLSMAAAYSTSDHVLEVSGRSSPDHFRAFAARGLEPLIAGSKSMEDLTEWSVPLERLRKGAGLREDEFTRFIASVRFEFGLGEAFGSSNDTRSIDLRTLSDALIREVARASGPVELDRQRVLDLVNWGDRVSFRSVHEFPIDGATYSPLTGAIDRLRAQLSDAQSGYVAVTGAPGAGKSTLLAQALAGLGDRVVRYFAFIPGSGVAARNRLSADWFLHDLSAMLRDAGLSTAEKKLSARTIPELRDSIREQLDAAAVEFAASGRKTVIVVDGLDHVHRDYSGNDALTAELPAPNDLPVGVIILVGTRDLTPLRAEARQFIDDAGTEINLEDQRLGKSAIIEVCERFAATSELPRSVHELIADRSAGHPLSLVYLLAQIEDYTGDDPEKFVAKVPQYDGDIAMLYRAVWESLDADGELERVLRVCSRLRIGFDLQWVRTWAADFTTRQFRTQLRYLFRIERGRWRFFHDSFRQFARDRTSIGDARSPDTAVDREAHAEVADICERSLDPRYTAQALYHCHQAEDHDGVLRLGTQEHFRQQFRELRPSTDIADDTKLVLDAAAHRGDFVGLLRGLLMLSEISDKSSEIEDINVCQILLRSGLDEAAIDYVGDEQTLRVPLAQAYTLAADLAKQAHPAGQRVFGMFQHFGLEHPGGARGVRADSEIARSWARCAAHFLPLDTALERMRAVLPVSVGEREWEFSLGYQVFEQMLTAFVDEQGVASPRTLQSVDAVLLDEVQLLDAKMLTESRAWDLTALLSGLRVRVLSAFLGSYESFEERVEVFRLFRSSLKGLPVPQSTLLDISRLEAEYDSAERALETLLRTSFDDALTLSILGASGDQDAIATHFSYWRLRHELEIGLDRRPSSLRGGPIASRQAAATTPAGNQISATAPIHSDTAAIQLANRIDLLVRQIALVQALIAAGVEVGEDEVWEAISPVMNLFPPTANKRPDYSAHPLRSKRQELHSLAIDTFEAASPRLVERYERAMARKFAAQPREWHAALRIGLGVKLHIAGVSPGWLGEALEALEAEAPEQGVNGALNDLVVLADAYSDLGHAGEAQRACLSIWRTAFGLGSRNDYQLARWVQWLGRTAPGLKSLDDEAAWFARLLAAADPLTDQGIGAEHLPEVLAGASPRVALNTFEYLVAHGAVSHMDAMGKLVAALLQHSSSDYESIELSAEIASAIIAASSSSSHPELGAVLAERASSRVLDTLRTEICKVALPTTRDSWLRSLSPTSDSQSEDDESDEYGGLELRDGRRLSRSAVRKATPDLGALRALVAEESPSSYFRWIPILDRNFAGTRAHTVASVFVGASHEADVLVWAAEREHSQGRVEAAEELARSALDISPLGAWSRVQRTTRRDAIRLLVKTGALTPIEAAQDFVRFITEDRWYSSMLNTDLDEIFAAFSVDTSGSDFWETVHEYLEGLSENLKLPAPIVGAPKLKWWLSADLPGRRAETPLEAAQAIAELAAMHLTHPAWAVREGTAQVVVSALKRNSTEIVDALLRLVDSAATDDVLEAVASCLAAADPVGDVALGPLRERIATHRSMVIRRLSRRDRELHEFRIARQLPAVYRLRMFESGAPDPETRLGADLPFLHPFEGAYELLSQLCEIDINTLLSMAGHYATRALADLPDNKSAQRALLDAGMKLIHPTSAVLASRSAFGYVLSDLVDSGMLGHVPLQAERELRTGDSSIVGRRWDQMPTMLPAHPPAGHDQTPDAWLAGLEARLDEYVRASSVGPNQIVGARSELAVLNWPHVEEHFVCDVVRRNETSARTMKTWSMRITDLAEQRRASADSGEVPLLLRNDSSAFMERRADWLALHPLLAAELRWEHDPEFTGGWRTSTGHAAASTVIWTNGSWGRQGEMFDDVVSEGTAVALTPDGLSEATSLLGPLDLVLTLSRFGRREGGFKATAVRRIEL